MSSEIGSSSLPMLVSHFQSQEALLVLRTSTEDASLYLSWYADETETSESHCGLCESSVICFHPKLETSASFKLDSILKEYLACTIYLPLYANQ